jgi:peptide-methionine (S)-S-oxide reductase
MSSLPARPSREHLRKQAKRVARERSLPLAGAQRLLANDYGFRTWAELMRHVAGVRNDEPTAALFAAVRARDVAAVRRLLAEGVNPRLGDGRESPLHAAARRGPLEMVEVLIVGGALEWDTDGAGRTPLDVARRSRAREREAIIALLDRGYIADPSFRAAVAAIHAGDVAGLARLIDAEPRLLRERIVEPEVYRKAGRHQYFLDPKLFWFIANNPTLIERMPPNIIEIARVMIERGVDQADLDYALDLTMTSRIAREQGHQRPLMRLLLGAGAQPKRESILSTAAYHEIDALRALLDSGYPTSAPLAAALGDVSLLRDLIARADPDDVQTAFGLAVINGHLEAARIALDAGADVNAYLPVHKHSTALHQAAVNDDPALIEFLISRGARLDQRDTLWDSTPLNWAVHEGKTAAQAALAAANAPVP